MNGRPERETAEARSRAESLFVCITDRGGRILSLNDGFRKLCTVFGMKSVPILLEDCFPPTFRAHWKAPYPAGEEKEEAPEFVQAYPLEGGRTLSVSWRRVPLARPGGGILVEGRVRGGREVSRSDNDIRIRLVEDSPFPIMCVSNRGSLVYSNARGKELRRTWAGNAAFLRRLRQLVVYALGTGLNFTEEYETGGRILQLSIIPVENRSIACIVGEDATREKQAERELRVSEKQYRSIFEESKDMIYSILPDGTIIDINAAGITLLGGKKKTDLIGRKLDDFYLVESSRKMYLEKMKADGFIRDFEVFIIRDNGEIFIGIDTATSVRDESGNVVRYSGIIRDATERIKEEQLQIKANLELTEMNRELKKAHATLVQQEKMASIGQLAAGVAHEINNPLGFVKSNLQTLEKYGSAFRKALDELEKCTSDYGLAGPFGKTVGDLNLPYILADMESLFRETQDGLSRIGIIVRNLMSFSRKDRGESVQEYDLNEGVRSTLVISKNEYKYVAEVETDLGNVPPLYCNGSEINQVLLNLIVNAAQAIAGQKRETPGRISVRTYVYENNAYCEVADDGPGIPEEIRTKIFEPFFTTKPVGKGTGLGLSISYDIVRNRHSGSLTVRSEVGRGSTFVVALPVSEGVQYL